MKYRVQKNITITPEQVEIIKKYAGKISKVAIGRMIGVTPSVMYKNLKLLKLNIPKYGKFRPPPKRKSYSHGLSKHPLFRIWSAIKNRCYNKKHWAYRWYGAKGVTVCDEWMFNFKSFYDWAISNGWEVGLNIDKDIIPKQMGIKSRIYSPEMCSIVSCSDNIKAIRDEKSIKYNGEYKTITQWAKETGLSYYAIYARLRLKWPVEKIFTPIKDKGNIK